MLDLKPERRDGRFDEAEVVGYRVQIQPEGKRPMSVRDYLAGRPIRPGARLTDP